MSVTDWLDSIDEQEDVVYGNADGEDESSEEYGGMDDDGSIDLAILTDGLKAEREQGITIDVAYRFFTTEKRKFIVADTPGHEQYTRNMVTGASTADRSRYSPRKPLPCCCPMVSQLLPFVSVIIPIYNGEADLPDLLPRPTNSLQMVD